MGLEEMKEKIQLQESRYNATGGKGKLGHRPQKFKSELCHSQSRSHWARYGLRFLVYEVG